MKLVPQWASPRWNRWMSSFLSTTLITVFMSTVWPIFQVSNCFSLKETNAVISNTSLWKWMRTNVLLAAMILWTSYGQKMFKLAVIFILAVIAWSRIALTVG